MKPIIPYIHLNGTSKGELSEQRISILRALKNLQDRVSEGAPHPRDFYIMANNQYDIAYAEHKRRCSLLEDFQKVIELEMEAIGKIK